MPQIIRNNPHWAAIAMLALSLVLAISGFSRGYGSLDARVDNMEEKVVAVPTNREFDQFKESINQRFDTLEMLLKKND